MLTGIGNSLKVPYRFQLTSRHESHDACFQVGLDFPQQNRKKDACSLAPIDNLVNKTMFLLLVKFSKFDVGLLCAYRSFTLSAGVLYISVVVWLLIYIFQVVGETFIATIKIKDQTVLSLGLMLISRLENI